MLINTNDELVRFCESLSQERFITVDTEFMRDRTYWPKLCLIQVAGSQAIAAIDPLAEGIDLAPFFALLKAPHIIKVFHAARQDVEIFFHLQGIIPAPMADSQVMAMVCGYGDAVGYEALVNKLAKATIDKTSRFTDWSLRPLSERQLTYAMDDVRYLRPIYEKLEQQVAEKNREVWIREEMAILEDPGTYKLEPEDAWRRLKARIDKPRAFTLLRDLAAWREREAQRIDIPRSRVMRDETLLEIVYHAPADAAALGRVRGFQPDMAKGRVGTALLEVIRAAEARAPDPLPDDFKKKPFTNGIGPIADMLRVLLKSVSENEDVAPKLLANSADLDALAADDNAPIIAMQGWRYDIFGKKALELKQGKLAMRMKGKNIEFFDYQG